MSGTWTKQGEEPTLETFFADPIVDLLLRRDGLNVQDVWRAIDQARPSVSTEPETSGKAAARIDRAA